MEEKSPIVAGKESADIENISTEVNEISAVEENVSQNIEEPLNEKNSTIIENEKEVEEGKINDEGGKTTTEEENCEENSEMENEERGGKINEGENEEDNEENIDDEGENGGEENEENENNLVVEKKGNVEKEKSEERDEGKTDEKKSVDDKGKRPIIAFRKADILNGENPVLYDLNMEVYKGDFVYIVGKVGTGKTSIVRTIIAENDLEKGFGKVCGYDLRTIRDKEIPYLRRKLGVVFQDFQLLMDRNVEDNLLFVLKATGWKNAGEIDKRITEVLKAVGMQHKAHKMPHQLSGGEQQRVAIARAILNSPAVIVADEPTGNLDPETADGIMQLLRSINAENGTAVVMVTHNLNLCRKYRGRMFVCKNESCEELRDEETIDIDI